MFWQLTLAVPPCNVNVREDRDGEGFGVELPAPFGVGGAVTGGVAGGTVGAGRGDSGTDSGEGDGAGDASSFCTAWALKGSGRRSTTWLATACTALQPTITAVAVPSNQINGSQARFMLTRLLPEGAIVRIRNCSVGFLADLLGDNLPVLAADFDSRLVRLAAETDLDLLPVVLPLGLDCETAFGRRGVE